MSFFMYLYVVCGPKRSVITNVLNRLANVLTYTHTNDHMNCQIDLLNLNIEVGGFHYHQKKQKNQTGNRVMVKT